MIDPAARRRPLPALVLGGVMLVAALGLGIVAGAFGEGEDGPPGWLRLLLLLAAVGLLAGTLVYWRRLDEAAREAHKWAWYWGGSGGMLAAGALAGASGQLEAVPWRTWTPGPGDAGLVALGALLCVVIQATGYSVAWGVWWLRRR